MTKQYLIKFVDLMEKAVAILLMIAVGIAVMICAIQAISEILAHTFTLDAFLSKVLTLVVGIEFVKMLLLQTKESVIEVLLYAVARQIIITHDSALDNLIGVLAIAIIFMIQKYFMESKKETIGGKEHEG